MYSSFEFEIYLVDAATLKYSNDVLRTLIGPLGAVKSRIEEETGSFNFEVYSKFISTCFLLFYF